jgi:hypothetical protein
MHSNILLSTASFVLILHWVGIIENGYQHEGKFFSSNVYLCKAISFVLLKLVLVYAKLPHHRVLVKLQQLVTVLLASTSQPCRLLEITRAV